MSSSNRASKEKLVVTTNLKRENREVVAERLAYSLSSLLPSVVRRYATGSVGSPVLTKVPEREKIYVEVD